MTYRPGQVWNYQVRPGDEGSTFTVLRVEVDAAAEEIVHIMVQGVHLVPGDAPQVLSHIPILREALDGSVTERVSESSRLPDYSADYEPWRDAYEKGEAGVFSGTVAEAVDYVAAEVRAGVG